MDPKLKELLDNRFRDIVDYAYCRPHPELPDSPKVACERYLNILKTRTK